MRLPSILLVAAMLAAPPLLARADPATGGKPPLVKFDPANVVTFTGTVLGVRRADHGKGVKSVHLIVKVGDEQLSVHIGPDAWVDRQKIQFATGDEVEVKGSRFTYPGGVGVIAQSVTRGPDTLVVRDASGRPSWSGQLATK